MSLGRPPPPAPPPPLLLNLDNCFAWSACAPSVRSVAAWATGDGGTRRVGFVSASFTSDVPNVLATGLADVAGCMRLLRLAEKWYREQNMGLDTFEVGEAVYTLSQRMLDYRCPPDTLRGILSVDHLCAMPGSRYFLPATISDQGAALLEKMPDHYRSSEELMQLWSGFCDDMYDGEHLRWHASDTYSTVMKVASAEKAGDLRPCPQLARLHKNGDDPVHAGQIHAACRALLYGTDGSAFNQEAYRAYVDTCLGPRRPKEFWHFTMTCRNVQDGNPYVMCNSTRFDFAKAVALESAVCQRFAGLRVEEHPVAEDFVDTWAPTWPTGSV